MAEIITMPKMSDTMTEGVVAEWLKKVGDPLKTGDGLIAEIETDKATMELDLDERMDLSNFKDCRILYIGLEKGKAVPVDSIIAIIGENGEAYEHLLTGGTPAKADVPATPEAPAAVAETATPAVDTSNIKAEVIGMPKMSDTMMEGTLVTWLKKVGDTIKAGDALLAEVETDKATMEFDLDNFIDVTKYNPCTLLYIGIEEGKTVNVDDVIAVIGEPGADFQALLSGGKTASASATAAPVASETPAPVAKAEETVVVSDADGRVKASPLAKALAKDKGINIAQVKGTGENGRVVKADVDSFVPAVVAPKTEAPAKTAAAKPAFVPVVTGEESYEEFPVNQMRKTIARRLAESKFSAPEFYLTMEINMDKAMAARVSMNEISPVKISFNDMVIKAVAVALTKHPKVNSYWLGDKIRINHHVHIGMAVAVEDGLLVPVIRFANTKSLSQISAEAKDLGGKAKNKQLQPKDWEGNTFTVSNLGMFGIDEFTSIINQPESCILAVGGIKETVGVKNGQFYATNVMKVTLTCDHRTVDGATGAAFLQTFKQLLEDPYKLLV
ncbi:2-oxo acid dehydrogenase subunit E2 [Arcicella sp. DC2W]|uniref:Dihydrolipoamide acetyltransferase component of pyruvate dehydrogenase complex n=1 Tax=Arcicella gelida TaxID=2984195 RepID=A0ABU5S4R1_9BACT|nr:2-oxo acid dehydrogenase subunit E2 [Arcicella sp. DC2W]MEA5403426.1 2-oxo acid dehydrogenase subunit E2 [Arcicella sp. DC2W]